MTSAEQSPVQEKNTVFVEAKDLPIYCPGPKAPLWSMHPRVFIEVAKTGKGLCPYCSTTYQLKDGEITHGH